MEVTVNSPDDAAPIWDHFLLKGTEITVKYTDAANVTTEDKMLRVGSRYRWELTDRIVAIEIVVHTVFRYNGTDYPLLKTSQRFDVLKVNNLATGLVPTRWQKMSPDHATGLAKAAPPLHPLLRFKPGALTVAIEFVDITRLFNDIHGDTPWYRTFELLRGTPCTVRVLAALRGHPFIWYGVIPDSVAAQKDLQPNLLYYPADYGGITYASGKLEGITTPNHDTSVGNVQCGGETLFSFVTRPISDSDYDAKLEGYLTLTERFKKRSGRNPPPLHHFREALSYNVSGNTLESRYWDVPFGFEQALSEKKQILLIPQINNADGGIAIRNGLKSLVENAILLLYTQGNTLTYETVSVNKLILTCYSQSGGNLFTAVSKNLADIKALVCFEPQYMNQHLKGEDRSLVLGKDVIPLFLRQGGKVAIVGRHRQGWEAKYLPLRINSAELILLPDDAHYFMLDYPDASKPYNPNASPVLARRYSRLLKSNADAAYSDDVNEAFRRCE